MTLLTTEVKKFVVITMNKNKYFITNEQEVALRTADNNDKIYTKTGMFKVHQITEILPTEEYYNNNPDECPVDENSYPKLEYPNIRRRIFNSDELLKRFLLIWKRQRSAADFEVVTGGLDRLIAYTEKRLKKSTQVAKTEAKPI